MSEESILNEPIKEDLARRLKVVVWIVSAVVLLLVAVMRSPYKIWVSPEVEVYIRMLPETMATLNILVAALLLGGLLCIVRRNFKAHQRGISRRISALVIQR